jgi:hypothetical protein
VSVKRHVPLFDKKSLLLFLKLEIELTAPAVYLPTAGLCVETDPTDETVHHF